MTRHLFALAAVLLAAPLAAQTVSGCGTTAIAKPSNASIAKLTTEATCFGKARDIASGAVTARQTRIAQLTPAPIPPAPVPVPVPAPQPASGNPRVGINLNGLSNGGKELPFLDRFKNSSQWYISGGGYGFNPAPPDLFNANGYPKGQPAGSKYSINIPLESAAAGRHRWVLTYAGTATFDWNGRISVLTNNPGRIVFDANDEAADFGITTTDADPIHDAHLVREDQQALFAQGQYLNPDFVALIKHFSALRTMDWTCTNGSQVTSWSQRQVTADARWGCVPLEVQIIAANAADADLWLNIPAHADDDYIRQAVTMVRDGLSPSRRLHLEYSNEMWNGDFEQAKWASAQAEARWPEVKGQFANSLVWSGYRSAQMASIAKSVFGADADKRLAVVFTTWPGWKTADLDNLAADGVRRAALGSISSLFKEYAITTYFGNQLGVYPGNEADRAVIEGWAATGEAGLASAFQELEHGGLLAAKEGSLDDLVSRYGRHASQAKAWGLDLVAYEGGLSWYYFMAPDKGPYDKLLGAMTTDARGGTITAKMVTTFGAAGGKLLMQFADIGTNSQWGPWGMQPDLSTDTPRSLALKAAGGR